MNLNMNSVESLVAQIQGLSSNASDITQLHNFLKQSEDLLHSDFNRLLASLSKLDPSIHSLGFLYILEACMSFPVSKEQVTELLVSVARFINSCCAEQIHLAPNKFISVCKRFKDQVILLVTPFCGVAPLLTVIRKLQSSSEQLTTLHADLLLLCILVKCYKSGFSVLEDDIYEIDQPRDFFFSIVTTEAQPLFSKDFQAYMTYKLLLQNEGDVSHSESLTMNHTPVRDIHSPHLMDNDFDFRPSLGSGHVEALWNLNETRFSLEDRFEPMTFDDIEIQMTSERKADHHTDDEQMKESNAGNLVNEEHLYEKRSSLEEHAEPMIITAGLGETEIITDQQSEKIHQPTELLKHPDVGVNVDDEGPAGLGESFHVEKHRDFEQKKNVEASSSRKGKDRSKDDRSVSLCIDVYPETKISGSTSPDFISVRTPATKERTRISRKRKCIFDESIVIPNEYDPSRLFNYSRF